MNKLERDFNGILEKYGHSILLLHSDKKTYCSCYDRLTGSVDRNCPYCFGMGTIPSIEKHLVRDIDSRPPESLPYIANQQQFGEMAVAGRSYFFKNNVNLIEGDLIIEVDWQGDFPIYTGRGIYKISHIDPARFENGKITYYKAYVKDQPIKKTIRGFKIVQQANGVGYQMAEKR